MYWGLLTPFALVKYCEPHFSHYIDSPGVETKLFWFINHTSHCNSFGQRESTKHLNISRRFKQLSRDLKQSLSILEYLLSSNIKLCAQ